MILAEADVADTVERALRAIENDSPDYTQLLQRLLASPLALSILASGRSAREVELSRALFVELRKLRPLTLWVRDDAACALAAKRAASLDGAICRLAPGEQLPPPDGRECWLEVDASHAETTLRALPSGWGVIVTGDLRRLSFAHLRKAAPLRALGAVLVETPAPDLREALCAARLDVVVVHAGSAPTEALAARVLWSVRVPDERQLGALPIAPAGAVCDGKNALSWALQLASFRCRA
jgi:hypothetical protein